MSPAGIAYAAITLSELRDDLSAAEREMRQAAAA